MDEIDKFRQDVINSDTFCFYPFLELSTNPAGHVKPCCYYGQVLFKNPNVKSFDNVYSISNGDTFEDVWNSNAMLDIRKKMTVGERINACKTCYRDGDASMRVRSIREYKNNITILQSVKETIDSDYTAQHLPKRLELKPSNLCNLKCMMCNSYDSSQVAKEIQALAEEYGGVTVDVGRFIKINIENPGITESNGDFASVDVPDWSENKSVWESFIKTVPHLETLSFAGGEPTLIPFVENALRHCVDTGHAKHIDVFLSSNFTNLNKSFLEMMPKFKKFELIASIDGIGKVNDYCRFPSKWSQISDNFKKARQLMVHSNVKILINISVNLLNVFNLDELLFWIDEQSTSYPYYKEWPYNLNLIWGPKEMRVEVLPEAIRLEAIKRLENYKKTSTVLKEFPQLTEKVDLIISQLLVEDTQSARNLEQFKYRVKILDKHREISISDFIPALKEIFNE